MVISVADVAEAFGVDRKTVRNWHDAGGLPRAGKTPGGHFRWDAAVIARVLADAGLPVPAAWGVAVAA